MTVKPKTWAHPKTLAEWRRRIIASMGGIEWNVELPEDRLDHAIWQTLILFNKYKPKWKWRPLGQVSGDAQFDLSDEPVGVRVVDVKFKRTDTRYTKPFHLATHYGFHNLRQPRKLYKMQVADDRYNSMLGLQPLFKFDDETMTLFISSESPLSYQQATALLLLPLKVEEIPFHQEHDFLNGAVGYAKLLAARILRKYGDIPAAQGAIKLDYTELKEEGKEAVADLKATLERNQKHMPPRPIFS